MTIEDQDLQYIKNSSSQQQQKQRASKDPSLINNMQRCQPFLTIRNANQSHNQAFPSSFRMTTHHRNHKKQASVGGDVENDSPEHFWWGHILENNTQVFPKCKRLARDIANECHIYLRRRQYLKEICLLWY